MLWQVQAVTAAQESLLGRVTQAFLTLIQDVARLFMFLNVLIALHEDIVFEWGFVCLRLVCLNVVPLTIVKAVEVYAGK